MWRYKIGPKHQWHVEILVTWSTIPYLNIFYLHMGPPITPGPQTPHHLNPTLVLPVNKIVHLPPYRLQYFSRTQHRPACIVLALCCILYCIRLYNVYVLCVLDKCDWLATVTQECFCDKMCYNTISKRYSKFAWSKISIFKKRQNVSERISSDLATLELSSDLANLCLVKCCESTIWRMTTERL